ncbi:MAG: arginine--tRNA ligase [Bacteroidota bacterium]
MQITDFIKLAAQKAFTALYQTTPAVNDITLNETKPEFEGDYTIVMFAFVKQLGKSPDALATELGDWLIKNEPAIIVGFNVIKGFLNLSISNNYWLQFLRDNNHPDAGKQPSNGKKAMIEYSSPNTNKPLHLGHLRNNFLGWSVAEIYKASGYEVIKTCVVNDRGVHICKSMLAWKRFGNGATPENTNTKGDHLVGDYYVKFENALKAEATPVLEQLMAGKIPADIEETLAIKAKVFIDKLNDTTLSADKQNEIKEELKEIARNASSLMQEVRSMLLKWEQGDAETIALWQMMNSWVYKGFDETYQRIGSDFQIIYYESDTYLLGKQLVEEGIASGVFFRKEEGSVWIDLTADGLDEKLVLRKDGTSVYITQDIGLARRKYEDFPMQESIYVIGDEQIYHMKVLQLICQRLAMPFAKGIHHLSYGMVDLPTGRMKSREGTVVDADDLCNEMEQVAASKTEELGKVKDFTPEELKQLYHTLGMGALKFYLLRVDPKKRMVFNPEESIDFHGFTGPFVQYTYARIQSVLRKFGAPDLQKIVDENLLPLEKSLVVSLEQFGTVINQSAFDMNPSGIALYVYDLAKTFNSFYTEHSIGNAENEEKKQLRLAISQLTGYTIKNAMQLLGISVPGRM